MDQPQLDKRFLGHIAGIDVYAVDFNQVKLHTEWDESMDVTEGANPCRFGFVPKNQIWVDSNLSPRNWGPIVLHEVVEFSLMASGLSYTCAHPVANMYEAEFRRELGLGEPGGKPVNVPSNFQTALIEAWQELLADKPISIAAELPKAWTHENPPIDLQDELKEAKHRHDFLSELESSWNVSGYSLESDINKTVKDWEPPTEAEASAGNYKKPRINLHGIEIAIENPKGTKRRPEWPKLAHHYGYASRVAGSPAPEARDGDKVDIFVGPNPDSQIVFVVDQEHPSGRYDEPKVLLGFTNEDDAKKGYLDSYQDGWHCGPITALTVEQFKEWLSSGDTTKRIADQVSKYSATTSQFERRDAHGHFTKEGVLLPHSTMAIDLKAIIAEPDRAKDVLGEWQQADFKVNVLVDDEDTDPAKDFLKQRGIPFDDVKFQQPGTPIEAHVYLDGNLKPPEPVHLNEGQVAKNTLDSLIAETEAEVEKYSEVKPQKLIGGAADNVPLDTLPQPELKKGIEHEGEHTDDPDIAAEIASDHIVEDPKYYDKLEKLESGTVDKNSMHDSIHNVLSEQHAKRPMVDVQLDSLYQAAKTKHPELTVADFHKTLSDLSKQGRIRLSEFTGAPFEMSEGLKATAMPKTGSYSSPIAYARPVKHSMAEAMVAEMYAQGLWSESDVERYYAKGTRWTRYHDYLHPRQDGSHLFAKRSPELHQEILETRPATEREKLLYEKYMKKCIEEQVQTPLLLADYVVGTRLGEIDLDGNCLESVQDGAGSSESDSNKQSAL